MPEGEVATEVNQSRTAETTAPVDSSFAKGVDHASSANVLPRELGGKLRSLLERSKNNNTKDILENYGLDSKKLVKTWAHNSRRKEKKSVVERNLENIKILESKHPGSSKQLFEEFGIENFGRYPPEVLLQQYENRNNKDLPYGVMIMNKADHNGAFYYDTQVIDDMNKQLEDVGYGIRIIECNSKIDMLSSLDNLNTRYGKNQKMEFAVIGAHGNRTGILLGRPSSNFAHFFSDLAQGFFKSSKYTLNRGDMNKPIFQRLKGYFKENPTWLLWSCSTGKRFRGIGKKISKELGAQVIAPDKPFSIHSVTITKDREDRLQFNQKYENKNLVRRLISYIHPLTHRPIRSRTYEHGKPVR